ncbi:transglutaminase family protein [soil metagenome]
MHIRVGCAFTYQSEEPTAAVALVRPRLDTPSHILNESLDAEPPIDHRGYVDHFGNRSDRMMLPAGASTIRYDARIEITGEPDEVSPTAQEIAVEQLPDEILTFTLSSRYCPTEALAQVAWDLFGQSAPGWSRVQAICDWVHQHMRYGMVTTPLTTAVDVYVAGGGMCRDFAHLAITFCRALTIPARYVFGYLPDIDVTGPQPPMDFHAWFEVYLDGRWWTFDARFNRPRIGRIPIGYGRDAVDVAMVTTYGSAVFQQMEVWSDPVTDASDDLLAQRERSAHTGVSEGLILGTARREPS